MVVDVLRAACVPGGIIASQEDRANYRRIWTRDAVVCGLAGVSAGDPTITAALGRSLDHLVAALGPHGEVPSNVALESPETNPSYGSLAGRVDAGAWLAIGARHLPDGERFEPAVRGAFDLYDRWELNTRGLIYSPMGGGWADEYPISGYTLTEQLLRLWALRLWGEDDKARSLEALLEANFWVGWETATVDHYHPVAYQRAIDADAPRHWLAALSPAGYVMRYDALANALAILLGLGSREQRESAARAGLAIADDAGGILVPAFWPPIGPGEHEYAALEALCTHGFRNQPGHYHNGGCWPMVCGFFAEALRVLEMNEQADWLAAAIAAANRTSPTGDEGDDFYEYHVAGGGPAGVRRCSWSAAGEIIAVGALLDFGSKRA